MTYNFDRIINRIPESATKHVNLMAKFGRTDVIPLWVADMDFATAPAVTAALQKRLESGVYGYTVCPESYYEALIGWQQRRNGWTPRRELLSNCSSIVAALRLLMQAITQPGDEVLFFSPAYPPFYSVPEQWGRKPVTCPLLLTDAGYRIDWAALESALAKKPAMMILCSPHNPVGRCWSHEELEKISRLCLQYGVLVVSDEIHADLTLFGHRHIPTAALGAEIAANTITCLSASKSFNLAGMQICTLSFPTAACKALFDAQQAKAEDCVNALGWVAAQAAWNEGEGWFDQLRSYLEGNLLLAEERLTALPSLRFVRPEATYLLWLDCRELGLDGADLMDFFVNKAGLGVGDGRDFRGPAGWVRVNLALPRKALARALDQLAAALA